ncbi:MAG: metallophosphoesterase family protein [Agitococcus sp.]|nr:metallophosphoesterase family protein [Agitococcus sp.]
MFGFLNNTNKNDQIEPNSSTNTIVDDNIIAVELKDNKLALTIETLNNFRKNGMSSWNLNHLLEGNFSILSSPEAMIYLLKEVSGLFRTYPHKLLTLSEDKKCFYIAGDLHADFVTLKHIFKKAKFLNDSDKITILFLGDYIDRGKDVRQVIELLVVLKYLFPESIHLLRGNHELYIEKEGRILSPMMGASDTTHFFDNWDAFLRRQKNDAAKNSVKSIINGYMELFDAMPLMALCSFGTENEKFRALALHGGLPRADLHCDGYYPKDIELHEWLNPQQRDSMGREQSGNILWSDPSPEENSAYFKNTSEIRFKFNKDQFVSFSKNHDIDMIFRAHEAHNDGFNAMYENRLMTVFSTGGKNRDVEEVMNPNSHYNRVSPNIFEVDYNAKQIISWDITFDDAPFFQEKEFTFEQIRSARREHENSMATYQVESIRPPTKADRAEYLYLVDLFSDGKTKIPVKVSRDQLVEFSFTELQQIYGIATDTRIAFDFLNNTIVNNSKSTVFTFNGNEILPECSSTIDTGLLEIGTNGAKIDIRVG